MSIEDTAFKLEDSVSESINKKVHVSGIFCYLARALDCVNHKILLATLHFIGVQETTLSWFR
jgi:hypothetical protein